MEVQLKPETATRVKDLAAAIGRTPDELVEDVMAGYLQELAQVREKLDRRYDEIESGQVKPIDGKEAFERLLRRERSSSS